MKYILIIFSFMSLIRSSECHAEQITRKPFFIYTIQNQDYQDTLISYLSSLDITYYKNKPVDSFLVKLPSSYSSMVVQGLGKLKYARILKVKYPGNVRVLIFVNNFQYMNPVSETAQWNINLFRKENIACIEIWDGGTRLTDKCKYWE